jgi:hypothetical protein
VSSVIVELQRESLDQNVSVSELLRKALVVARKLKLVELQKWIENELNGYKDEVPDYRVASGQIRGWNPYNGWIPLIFEDPKEADALSKRGCSQSIAEIEDLLQGESSTLHMPYPQHIQRKLSKGFEYETEVSLFVGRGAIVRIVDSVRNVVLNWALELEEQGVLGQGLSFSEEEKEAATSTSQNINNFYGPVHGPQIAQGNQQAIQVSSAFQVDVESLKALIANIESAAQKIDILPDKRAEFESELATLRAQASSPNPKKGIVKEGLSSLRNILEGASGSALGQIMLEIGKMLGG